jgi:hypothetical protein
VKIMSNGELKAKEKGLQTVLSELYHARQTQKAVKEKEKSLSSQAIELMEKLGKTKTSFNANKIGTLVESVKREIDTQAFSELVPHDDFIASVKVQSAKAKRVLSENTIDSISTITGTTKAIRIS